MKSFPRLLLSAISLSFVGVFLTPAAPARPFTPLKLSQVRGLALDPAGNLYVPDIPTSTLYRITPAGASSIVPSAPIKHVHAPAVAPDGNVYVVETEVSKGPSPRRERRDSPRPARTQGCLSPRHLDRLRCRGQHVYRGE